MAEYIYWTKHWIVSRLQDGWVLLDGLDRQEWFVLLACAAAIGFLCMRGYGSRTGY